MSVHLFSCRSPFEGGAEYVRVKKKVIELGSKMLAAAQGDDYIANQDEIMDAVSLLLICRVL